MLAPAGRRPGAGPARPARSPDVAVVELVLWTVVVSAAVLIAAAAFLAVTFAGLVAAMQGLHLAHEGRGRRAIVWSAAAGLHAAAWQTPVLFAVVETRGPPGTALLTLGAAELVPGLIGAGTIVWVARGGGPAADATDDADDAHADDAADAPDDGGPARPTFHV